MCPEASGALHGERRTLLLSLRLPLGCPGGKEEDAETFKLCIWAKEAAPPKGNAFQPSLEEAARHQALNSPPVVLAVGVPGFCGVPRAGPT